MSGELKRKLYDYEVTPSEQMWSRIASALDEEINADFPQMLYEIEVNPPATSWQHIASAINSGTTEEYPAKLFNLEVAPPADAWQKISASLEEEKRFPQIPAKRRITPFVRYAAAACIIGALAFGALKLVNRKTADRVVAGKVGKSEGAAPASTTGDLKKDSSSQTVSVADNNLPKVKATVAKNSGVKRRSNESTGYMTLLADASGAVTNSSAPYFQHASLKVGEVPGNCAVISEEDRYLNFMNPDGYLVRISKKLAYALKCYFPTRNSDDNQCDEQIKKWRDKIAQSPGTSSPDNFMDVLNIIKTVQDKEL
jgi:hypothetical protein